MYSKPRRSASAEPRRPIDFIARNRSKVSELSQNQKIIRLNSQSVTRAPAKRKTAKKPKQAKKAEVLVLKCLERPVSFMLVEKFTSQVTLSECRLSMQVYSSRPPSNVSAFTSADNSPHGSMSRSSSRLPSPHDVNLSSSSLKRKRSVDSQASSKRSKLSSN